MVAAFDRETVITLLEKAGVSCGQINDIAEVFDDPQVQARGLRVDQKGLITAPFQAPHFQQKAQRQRNITAHHRFLASIMMMFCDNGPACQTKPLRFALIRLFDYSPNWSFIAPKIDFSLGDTICHQYHIW